MARKKLETTKAVETTSTIVGNGTEEKVTATVEPTVTDKTEEKELPMVEPINLKEQKKEYNRLVGLIKREYGKVENSSLNIAFALHQIYSQELYLHDGFKNIMPGDKVAIVEPDYFANRKMVEFFHARPTSTLLA